MKKEKSVENTKSSLITRVVNNKKFLISLLIFVLLLIFMLVLANINNGDSKVNKIVEKEAIRCAQDLKDNRLFSIGLGNKEKFETFEIKWTANSSGERLIFIDAQTDSTNRAVYAYIDGKYAGSDNLADMTSSSYDSMEDRQMIENSKQIKKTWENTTNTINVENVMKKVK